MKLLLHACCGPCSLEPTRLLREAGHDIGIFYANSNIHPTEEYTHRLTTLKAWAQGEGVPVIEGVYDPASWERTAGVIGDAALAEARGRASAGLDGPTGAESPEGAASPELPLALAIDPARREARCRACYRLRLKETAAQAVRLGFDGIATTLSVSPYQYTEVIRQETERAAERAGIAAIFQDFRPYYDEATRRSRELGMYRQNYCGCRFSDDEAAAERQLRKLARKQKKAAERAARAIESAEAREARKAERAAYDQKQARKRAILKALRQQRDS